MSVQSIQGQAQNAELYQIHKKSGTQEAQQAEQSQQAQATQTDEYDKANPVGEEAEGVYSVSYDEEGSLKVNYTQPGGKSQASGGAQASGSSDNTEEEIEQLKKQRDQIKQQLNKEKDEEVKKALRAQLQVVEAQIAQKSASLKG